jgi:hypothetical protein
MSSLNDSPIEYYLPTAHYRQTAHEIKTLVVGYIVELDDTRRNHYVREEAKTALLRVAIGAAMEETITSHCCEHRTTEKVPYSSFDHLLNLLDESLQFGWLKPRMRSRTTEYHYNVKTTVTLPNRFIRHDDPARKYIGTEPNERYSTIKPYRIEL